MNWKLILGLSLVGLAMGIATVFWIPSNVEPFVWVVIFVFSAVVIAKRCGSRPFLHGLLVSVANSIWITGAHVLLFDQYLAHHPDEASMMQTIARPDMARLMMAVIGPAVGVISGVVLGFFSLIAFKLVARNRAA
jgi:hypothetical protein